MRRRSENRSLEEFASHPPDWPSYFSFQAKYSSLKHNKSLTYCSQPRRDSLHELSSRRCRQRDVGSVEWSTCLDLIRLEEKPEGRCFDLESHPKRSSRRSNDEKSENGRGLGAKMGQRVFFGVQILVVCHLATKTVLLHPKVFTFQFFREVLKYERS